MEIGVTMMDFELIEDSNRKIVKDKVNVNIERKRQKLIEILKDKVDIYDDQSIIYDKEFLDDMIREIQRIKKIRRQIAKGKI